jgi:hypothetical protein
MEIKLQSMGGGLIFKANIIFMATPHEPLHLDYRNVVQ